MSKTKEAPAVLAPYVGFKRTRTQIFLRKILVPFIIVFCLVYGLAFGVYGPFMPLPFAIAPAVLGLIAVWALPEMKTAPTRQLEALLYVFLVVLLLWPNYLAISLPGLPWITPLRMIAAPMALVFLVCLSVSPPFRKELLGVIQASPWIWKGVVAFAAIQMITVLVATHPTSSLNKVINDQFNWTMIFFASAFVFAKPGRANLWAALLCATFAVVAPVVLLEVRMGQVPWANHIPSFLKVNDPSVARILAGGVRDGIYRAQGTFSSSLSMGEYAALTMPFLLYYVTGAPKLYLKVLAGAAIPVMFWVVIKSDSRIGYIGCLLAMLIYAFAFATHLWRTDRHSVIAPTVVFGYPAVMTVAFLITLFVGRIRQHVWGTGQFNESNRARMEMYTDGIPMIVKRPWGVGAGNGAEKLGHTNPGGMLSIDTYYIQVGLEYGVLGFIIYYGTFGLAMYLSGREALNLPKRGMEQALLIPVSVALLNYFLIKSSFSQEDGHSLAYMLLGMVVGFMARKSEATSIVAPQGEAPTRPVRRLAGALQPAKKAL